MPLKYPKNPFHLSGENMEKGNVVTILKVDNSMEIPKVDAFIFRVKKRGRKYLHGNYGTIENGKVEFYDWESKINIEEDGIRIFSGVREDLLRMVQQVQNAIIEYSRRKEEARRRIHSEAYNLFLREFNRRWEEWKENNPAPNVQKLLGLNDWKKVIE